MDDIEEKCEDNLTDSDSTPVLPNKSFILPQAKPSPLLGASESEPSSQSSASTHANDRTATNWSLPISASSTSSSPSPAPASTSTSTDTQSVPHNDKRNQAKGRTSCVTSSAGSDSVEDTAQGATPGNQSTGNLIGSEAGLAKNMASALTASSSPLPSSPSFSTAATPGAASLIGSYNNPKYRIASSLASSISPSSSTSPAPYKRMPHLHKLEK
ncbi:hypothetical protein RRG08_054085 [Elysia crispata]|uniref:Uncharacterized protein n=1 Tax=Elysia crispata TaxID=231223 RepID=A0AAE0ZES0_9GAST|nr:hypothetical protein RRG08_054085 [Elysia crispata]